MTHNTTPADPGAVQGATILAEIIATTDGTLDLHGFWRLFGGGGHCRLRFDAAIGEWHGILTDSSPADARHAPVECRFSAGRMADFLRLAVCHRDGPGRWVARYQEPA